MTTNPTQRHTARPSRSRIMRARIGAWCDAHPVVMLTTVGALTLTLLSALAVFALISDGTTLANAVGAVGVSLCGTLIAVLYAVLATHEHTTDTVSRRAHRAYARVMRERDDEMARVIRDSIGTRSVSEMSAYEMSAELARLATREAHLRNALRVKVRA